MRPPRVLPTTAASTLAGIFVAGCANPPPPVIPTGPDADTGYVTEYSCCSPDPGGTVWQPGQQIKLGWLPSGGQPTGDKLVAQVTLTAVLTGPYPTVHAASLGGPGHSRTVATAPIIKVSTVSLSGPVSALTIPRSAAPGYYNLWTTAATETMSEGGGSAVAVG